MNNIPELVKRLLNVFGRHTNICCTAADALEHALRQDAACQSTIESLQARIKDLEQKSEFNERWIAQTCTTGEIKAKRNQCVASDSTWILSVMSPLEEELK